MATNTNAPTPLETAQATGLIRYYNSSTGSRIRTSNVWNIRVTVMAIRAVDGDLNSVRTFICSLSSSDSYYEEMKKFARNHGGPRFIADGETPADEAPTPTPATEVTASPEVASMMTLFNNLATSILASVKGEEVKAEVRDNAIAFVKDYIMETYGPITRKVTFELPERKYAPNGVVHGKFETILKFVNANEPVYLAGPAGSGKNVICKQIAEAMGLDFYFTNAVTQEYKLTGFTDANGTFHETQFYKAFKNGGVFMLDEMDASIPEVLIILNAAIANRYFDFPAPIGYVEANPNFRLIAAGNTFGSGADIDYVGRSQLDAASLDRFAIVKVDYDSRIEESVALGNTALLDFCRKFRKATQNAGIHAVVSYRAIGRLAKLYGSMPTDELLDTCLVKSLELDDLNAIKSEVSDCGEFTTAFNAVIESRKGM